MPTVQAFILGDGVAIALDIVLREGHTSELEVTQNPVETGVVVSDHAFMRPLEIEIEGEISDTPLHGYDRQTGQPIADRFYSKNASRSATALEQLRGLQASADPFSVQTLLKLYPNMMLVSLNVEQDADTANGLPIRMRLREIIRRSTQTVTYPPRAAGKPHRQASKKVDGGEKKTDTVTDPVKIRTGLKQALAGDSESVFDAIRSLAH